MLTAKFSKDQKYLAGGDKSGKLFLFKITGTTFTAVTPNFDPSVGDIKEVDFNFLSTRLLVCGDAGFRIYTITASWPWTAGTVTAKNVLSCKFQKDGKYAIGENSGTISLHLATGAVDWSNTTSPACKSLDFDGANSSLIVSSGGGNTYKIFNSVKVTLPTLQTIYTSGTTPPLSTVAFSKDGSIYAGGGQSQLLVYENHTQTLLFNWTSSSSITAGVFTYDSQYYISGCSNGLVRIFKRNCLSCPAGTFENSSACLPCQMKLAGCTSCENASYCYTCGNGYVLDSVLHYCLLCHSLMPGCLDCNTATNCRACSSFYYLFSNNCSSCQLTIPNCLTCSSSSVCTLCISNYFVNSSNKCQSCTSLSNCA